MNSKKFFAILGAIIGVVVLLMLFTPFFATMM